MFDDLTTSVLTAAMRGGAARHAAIAQNLANADTPGYRRLSVSFEGALADALEGDREAMGRARAAGAPAGGGGGAWWDRPGGAPALRGPVGTETAGVSATTDRVQETVTRVDGSNIDPDDEMSQLAANQLAYNTATSLLVARFGQYRSVITGR
ncbi:MAG TPA: flagellar basal body protein [Miltoncostaeaceae bacterium]|nr:flagellar basal body protein [Miltoncostaeaceae bacterium]